MHIGFGFPGYGRLGVLKDTRVLKEGMVLRVWFRRVLCSVLQNIDFGSVCGLETW